jgi:hypothetical protein
MSTIQGRVVTDLYSQILSSVNNKPQRNKRALKIHPQVGNPQNSTRQARSTLSTPRLLP